MELRPVKLTVDKKRGRAPAPKPTVQRYRAGRIPDYVTLEQIERDDVASSSDDEEEEEAAEPPPAKERRLEDAQVDEEEDDTIERKPVVSSASFFTTASAEPPVHPLFRGDDAAVVPAAKDESDDDDSESSSNANVLPTAIKPVFKTKEQREALAALEEELELKRQLAALEEQEAAVLREQTARETVERKLQEEEAQRQAREEKIAMGLYSSTLGESEDSDELPDDEIEDEAAEYEAWQVRELGRLKRDWLERARRSENPEEREFLMMFEARMGEQSAEAAARLNEQQGNMGFMQKYYHRGAFFQDVMESGQERAFDKDYRAAVGEDAVDKSLLPAIMQVRRGDFGKRSRSKYTHLVDQDTTDRSSAWGKKS